MELLCGGSGRAVGGFWGDRAEAYKAASINCPSPARPKKKDGANQLRLSYIKSNISQNTHCTSSIYTSVPPPMLSSVLFFHLCST